MSQTQDPPTYWFPSINFNPAFYVDNVNAEEQAYLDAHYCKYPVVQNGIVSFINTVFGLTASNIENSTIVATTQFVNNFFTYIRTLPWTWSGIQSFTGGITANIINPVTVGGTLTIGNNVSGDVFIAAQVGRTGILHLGDGNNSSGAIHIGNGSNATNNVNLLNGTGSTGVLNLGSATSTTRVNTPLTPNYTYPVSSGKLGFINSVSVASLAVTPGTAQNLTQLTSLPAGVWFLQIDTYLTVGMVNGSFVTLGINTTSATLAGARAQNTIYVNGTTPAPTNSTSMTVSISAATTYYAIGLSNIAGTYNWTNIVFSATRIA